MISDKIVLFRRFQFEEDAHELALVLQDSGIKSKVVDNSPAIDITFTNSTPSQNQFEIFVRKSDFLEAEKILLQEAEKQSEDIPSDHYLLEFSDEELIQLLIEKDKWHELDQVFARKILEEKGTLPQESFFLEQEQLRIKALRQEEKIPYGIVIWGYLSAFGSLISILPSPFAILVSCYILRAKKVLPNGEKIFIFSKKARDHGYIILGISLAGTIVGLVAFYLYQGRFFNQLSWYLN